VVNSCQLTLYHTVWVRQELHDIYIAARNGMPPWSTKAFARTVCEIEHYDDVSSRIFADEFPEKHPQELTKEASITLEKATEAHIVEVIAKSHCLNRQLISCKCSTYLL